MITQYEVRVRRPWPGVKKGEVIKVNGRRKVQLVRGGFAVVVEEGKQEAPQVDSQAVTKKKRRVIKKKV